MALINKLEAIGEAIRSKTGKSALLTLDEMPTEIQSIVSGGGGEELPEEAFVISGNCMYRFANGGWDWFIRKFGNRITTSKINRADSMFYYSTITELPFALNFEEKGCSCNSMFCSAKIEHMPPIDFNQTSHQDMSGAFKMMAARDIGTLKNMYPEKLNEIFSYCYYLRDLPQFEGLNLSRLYSYQYAQAGSMFSECYSLRSVSTELLKQLYTPMATTASYIFLYGAFNKCYSLDEIVGVSPQTGTVTSNIFITTFKLCTRTKEIIFDTQADGTPYSAKWKSQTIDLSDGIGYVSMKGYLNNILNYNSGITADKEVTSDASYQALKDDPNWFTQDVAYSRYNHNSAVNTINSLPDTSAYLSTAGGTNTIKFRSASGSATDGGAINTLTEEEIAVATAKGWTVTFV